MQDHYSTLRFDNEKMLRCHCHDVACQLRWLQEELRSVRDSMVHALRDTETRYTAENQNLQKLVQAIEAQGGEAKLGAEDVMAMVL